jgi:hypothetical protein
MTAAYEHGGQYPGNGAAPSGQPTETEIGNIIIEAQRFADATAVEARRAADAIVAQARAEADRIVQEAQRQAVATATHALPALPPAALSQLVATIDGFARTNSALIGELAYLRQSLAAQSGAQAVQPAAPEPAVTRPSPAPVPIPQTAPAPQATPIQPPGRVPVTQGMQGQVQARPVAPSAVPRSA